MKATSERRYLPAAGHDAFLPLYDLMTAVLGADRARRALLEQPELRAAEHVLDIGCGTGTFVMQLKRRYPEVTVVGLDPDRKALSRARRKAERARVIVRFDQGFADELPYPPASFDGVFSSFMFHHLETGSKERTLREVRRVLKPGGRLYLLDVESEAAHAHGVLHLLPRMHERVKDNVESQIVALMRSAGFDDATRVGECAVFFGSSHAGFYRASSPAGGLTL